MVIMPAPNDSSLFITNVGLDLKRVGEVTLNQWGVAWKWRGGASNTDGNRPIDNNILMIKMSYNRASHEYQALSSSQIFSNF